MEPFAFNNNFEKRFWVPIFVIITLTISLANGFPIFIINPIVVEGSMKTSLGSNSLEVNPIVVWNNLTTNLALKAKMSPLELARTYTLVHISIYDSLLDNKKYQDVYDTEDYAIIAGAASTILSYLFPDNIGQINQLKEKYVNEIYPTSKEFAYNKSMRINEGFEHGEIIGEQIIKFAAYQIRNSNSTNSLDELVKNSILTGPCIWNGSNPVLPTAGTWKTFILKSGSEIQPSNPAPCGSYEDIKDLIETYQARINITPQQVEAVHYWGDRLPPVIWNHILNERITKNNMSIFDAAYASVYLNVGMYDGFVSCWYTKYDHWTARPFQRIPNFTTIIPTPNFPGFTSGHSVISAVASKVLGEVFPNGKSYFENQASEAALTRLWAGIHFKQDIVQGFDQGIKIGNVIVEDMNKPFHPFVFEKNQY